MVNSFQFISQAFPGTPTVRERLPTNVYQPRRFTLQAAASPLHARRRRAHSE